MLYSMDQLVQWRGATQVLATHRSNLGGCASAGQNCYRQKSESKRRIKSKSDQVESSSLLMLILCLSSDSGRRLSEMHADVFHSLTLLPWLNKPNASLTKKKPLSGICQV